MTSLDMLNWHNARSEEVTIETILTLLSAAATNSTIHVGCDSHFVKNKCIYALVVAICTPGKGGTYFFARKKFNRKKFSNMKLRLLKEVENCLEIADLISSKTSRNDIQVHLDINPNKLYKSS